MASKGIPGAGQGMGNGCHGQRGRPGALHTPAGAPCCFLPFFVSLCLSLPRRVPITVKRRTEQKKIVDQNLMRPPGHSLERWIIPGEGR